MKIDDFFEVSDKPREECAVFGISINGTDAAGITYNALLSMQHRGQEGSGIAVAGGDNIIDCFKAPGLVSEVFTEATLAKLPPGGSAIGHNRYSTTGSNTTKNVQPFVKEYFTGRIAAVHNGNITNAKIIRKDLRGKGIRFEATSDSEVVASLITYFVVKTKDLKESLIQAANRLEGSFTLIILCGHGKILAVRDANGYRPLCIGENEHGIAIASESCALDSCGFGFVRDVMPGEVVMVEDGKITYSGIDVKKRGNPGGLCVFEYVYFARPDSVIDKLSVYEARYNMGVRLAKEHPAEADIVCGVPDSGLEAAVGYAAASKIPLVTGFVKNRYIGRSFIYPTQTQRESAVRLKLNPLSANVDGKRVVLVDDSIVRGTTSARIVKALREAGAREVHMRVSSPPFRYTCHYGTDIDSEENLIANQMSISEICARIGADSLGYISMEELRKACGKCPIGFCDKCFEGYAGEKMKTSGRRKNDLE